MSDKFVHLHVHNEFSLFDGYGKAAEVASHVAKLGQPAVALTNHGNVCGLIQHFNACRSHGIKPILGVEAYFVPNALEKKRNHTHLTILVKDDEGYKNLMRLVSEANDIGYYYVPRVDFAMLKKYAKGLIILTGCTNSLFSKVDAQVAIRLVKEFKSLTDTFIEVQPHTLGNQKELNEKAVYVSNKTKAPLVMTMDAHYISKEDALTHMYMRRLHRPEAAIDDYKGLYLHPRKAMKLMWEKNYGHLCKADKLLDITLDIANACNVTLDFGPMSPKLDWGMPAKEKLTRLAVEGLKRRGLYKKQYVERLKHELDVVFDLGFEDIFLICWDVVNWAHNNGIRTGFGRGSVCGSLLAYAIGLTEVDPLIYGTVFERFLRKDKKKMPDIDTDFDKRYRHRVFEYVSERFGGVPVVTYGRYKVRNLVNDLSKALNIDPSDKSFFSTRLYSIIEESGSIEDMWNDPEVVKRDKYGLLKHFSKLYDSIRYFGQHASGIAVGNNITDYVALFRRGGKLLTSYDLKDLETLNILKIDVLGLDTVSVIAEAEEQAGIETDLSAIDDPVIYERFSAGDTTGVFQFESYGAREVLKRVEPKNIFELIACNALNRPAPIRLGVLDNYVEGKKGMVNKNDILYKYASETYGAVIYQEQVMTICRGLAGMSWQDADKVMKKLDPVLDPNDELYLKFVDGAVKNGVKKSDAKRIYQNMTKYLFNKAHGTAYSLMSAYTMWLLINYPLEYIYALLLLETREDKIREYEQLAAKNDIVVLLAHVNGKANYSIVDIDGEKAIQQGLLMIKGVGESTALEIEKHRPYSSLDDLRSKVDKRYLRSNVMDALADYGALEFDRRKWWKRVIRYNASLRRL